MEKGTQIEHKIKEITILDQDSNVMVVDIEPKVGSIT